jgi:hypothetical protein
MGLGLFSGQLGQGARADVCQMQSHYGGWGDESGRTNYGFEDDAALARIGMSPGGALGPFGFDTGVLTANRSLKVNDETASVGAQANLIEGSVSVGNQEHGIRIGGSLGVGAAGRVHYGDADGDGVREYGFGFDIGPVSADVKSEYVGQQINAIKSAGSWLSRVASPLRYLHW